MNTGENGILLKVRNLRVSFRTGRTTFAEAVKGISFDVPVSRTVALVGESGSGKSVSALAVMGLLPMDVARIEEGSLIVFNGQELLAMDMADRRKLCGTAVSMVFQDPMTSLNPVFTVGYQIGEVLRLHKGMTQAQARERTVELLAEVGIPEPERRVDAYPHQLSGGQQQRVMIAMAVACEPKLLIADEPTTALDVTVQRQIIHLIQDLQKWHQMSVLFITHDLQLVSEMADDVIVMRYGDVKEQATAEQVFTHPADPYTRALMLCRPPMDSRPIHLPVIDDIIAAESSIPRLLSVPLYTDIKTLRKRVKDFIHNCIKEETGVAFIAGRIGHRELFHISWDGESERFLLTLMSKNDIFPFDILEYGDPETGYYIEGPMGLVVMLMNDLESALEYPYEFNN